MFVKIKQTLNKFLNWSAESVPNLILTSAAFFILGISIASVFLKNHFENFYLFSAFCFLFLLLVLSWRKRGWRLAALCLLFFILGFWRYNFSLPNFQIDEIKNYNGQMVNFVGIISGEPDKRSDHYKLTLEAEQVSLPTKVRNSRNYERCKVSGLVLLRAPLYPEYKYGDTLGISCKIKAPENLALPPIGQKSDIKINGSSASGCSGGKSGCNQLVRGLNFDYAAYLSRYGIYSVCNFPEEIRLLERGRGSWFYGPIYSLKNKLAEIGGKILPEPHASFLAALLYGARQGIPEDLTEQFNRASLTHVIAISGYNISLVVGILLPFFALFLPRRWAFPFIISGVVFFVLFAGASASVVRAGIMGIIAVLAKNTSRASQSGRILAIVAFLMLLQNPKLLFFDRGFSLSFAATAGLIYLVPIIKKHFLWWGQWIRFRQITEETISATLATLPLTIYYFDRISAVSILANIFVLPIIPAIMFFGFISLTGGLIWSGFGMFLVAVPWILISYIFKITEFFASFRLASIDLGKVSWIIPVILYGILAGWMIWAKRPKKGVVKVDKEVEEYEIVEDT